MITCNYAANNFDIMIPLIIIFTTTHKYTHTHLLSKSYTILFIRFIMVKYNISYIYNDFVSINGYFFMLTKYRAKMI